MKKHSAVGDFVNRNVDVHIVVQPVFHSLLLKEILKIGSFAFSVF
jgi:hypothetical protein